MISVIVPYWNSEKWLPRCIKSLEKQNGDFEFLFVNDRSEDKGPEILKQVKDDRFRLFDNERSAGVSGARNTGLDHATGEWITFLDADDILRSDDADRFDHIIRTDPQAALFQANHYRHYVETGKTALKFVNNAGRYEIYQVPHLKCWYGVWNKLIKAEAIEGVRFNEAMQYGEDEAFILKCLERCRYLRQSTEITLIRYFDNKKSLSRVRTKDDLLRQVAGLEEFLKCDDVEIRRVTLDILSEHFGSVTFKRVFCDEADE